MRAIYAAAFYGGLRRGELRALRHDDVDLAANIITVRHSWDDIEGQILPKSAAGTRRTLPIMAILRDHLTELKATTGRDGHDFVFGPSADRPFLPSNINGRAAQAWAAENVKRARRKEKPLKPISLHECRHSCVSLMVDAGEDLPTIGKFVGHSAVAMTDRYSHLIAGREDETRLKMDAYFARADTASRIAQVEANPEEA